MAPKVWYCVTGCDSGFGLIVSRMLAERGFGVFSTHLLPASAEMLKKQHSSIVPLHVNITQQDSVDAAVSQITAQLESCKGRLEGLVNNAGLMIGSGPVEWTPAENYEKMFAVNVVGAVRMTNGLLPLLRKTKGRIVNVASLAGRVSLPSQSAYSCTKFAMEGYSDALRREIMDWGVTVHIVEPGVFNKTGLYNSYHAGTTKMWEALKPSVRAEYGEKYRDEFSKRVSAALSELGNGDSTLVPKAMVEALTSPQPKYRYRVGGDAAVLIPLFGQLHESWQDAILRASKPGEERVKATAMREGDGDAAAKRYDTTGTLVKFLATLAGARVCWSIASKL